MVGFITKCLQGKRAQKGASDFKSKYKNAVRDIKEKAIKTREQKILTIYRATPPLSNVLVCNLAHLEECRMSSQWWHLSG